MKLYPATKNGNANYLFFFLCVNIFVLEAMMLEHLLSKYCRWIFFALASSTGCSFALEEFIMAITIVSCRIRRVSSWKRNGVSIQLSLLSVKNVTSISILEVEGSIATV